MRGEKSGEMCVCVRACACVCVCVCVHIGGRWRNRADGGEHVGGRQRCGDAEQRYDTHGNTKESATIGM